MKPKKITKKLSFSKSTITDLNLKELNDVHGGKTWNTCYQTCGFTCLHDGTICFY